MADELGGIQVREGLGVFLLALLRDLGKGERPGLAWAWASRRVCGRGRAVSDRPARRMDRWGNVRSVTCDEAQCIAMDTASAINLDIVTTSAMHPPVTHGNHLLGFKPEGGEVGLGGSPLTKLESLQSHKVQSISVTVAAVHLKEYYLVRREEAGEAATCRQTTAVVKGVRRAE